jgi:hypothetical protein
MGRERKIVAKALVAMPQKQCNQTVSRGAGKEQIIRKLKMQNSGCTTNFMKPSGTYFKVRLATIKGR